MLLGEEEERRGAPALSPVEILSPTSTSAVERIHASGASGSAVQSAETYDTFARSTCCLRLGALANHWQAPSFLMQGVPMDTVLSRKVPRMPVCYPGVAFTKAEL